MRITNPEDIQKLGPHARRQVEAALKERAISNQKRLSELPSMIAKLKKQTEKQSPKKEVQTLPKKQKPSRVMKLPDGRNYCPYPSTDPFVKVHNALQEKYGLFEDGGLLVTEMIVDGGEKNWRFDFALMSPFYRNNDNQLVGNTLVLIEADGFGFHRSKEAFKNDRTKQTHALKQCFVVQRITNQDARERLDDIMHDIDIILSHQRIYKSEFIIVPKGNTQCVFKWLDI